VGNGMAGRRRQQAKPLAHRVLLAKPMQRSRAQIAQFNRNFAAERRKHLALLKHRSTEPLIKKLSDKFSLLPFAYISDACQGHFYESKGSKKKAGISSYPAKKYFYFRNSHFEIKLNLSAQAERFKQRLVELVETLPFVNVGELTATIIEVESHLKRNGERVRQPTALQITADNRRFFKELEAIVNETLVEMNQ